MLNALWNEVFLTGEIEKDITDAYKSGSVEAKKYSVATALCGWANYVATNEQPEKFVEGMTALSRQADIDFDILMNINNLLELSKILENTVLTNSSLFRQ